MEEDKKGHRSRMIEKFLEKDNSFTKIDLLEVLLYFSIPRKDTRPIAKSLMSKFNNLSEIMSATPDQLKGINSLGKKTITNIKIFQKIINEINYEKIEKTDILENFSQLIQFCKTMMAYKQQEELLCMFLTSKNHIIKTETMCTGTITSVSIYPREILKRALELTAQKIVLVHNHPSGDPTPSKADIEITQEIYKLFNSIGMSLEDHIIIGKQGFVSFRLNHISPFV